LWYNPGKKEEPAMTKAIKELKLFSLDDHRREAVETIHKITGVAKEGIRKLQKQGKEL
jgi:hypothetical protein